MKPTRGNFKKVGLINGNVHVSHPAVRTTSLVLSLDVGST